MEDILTLLIEDDIRITRLVRTLATIGIDASAYTPNKTTVVLKLLQLDYETHSDEYLKLLEESADTGEDQRIVEWLGKVKELD